jgi:hypothetical protein
MNMRRRRSGIERFELFGNRVQAREGAAIVVLIVALDEPWRDAQKSPRPAEQRCDLISHVDASRIRRGRLRAAAVSHDSLVKRRAADGVLRPVFAHTAR